MLDPEPARARRGRRARLELVDLLAARLAGDVEHLDLALGQPVVAAAELHARLYGDRPVSQGTLKAEMSQLRAVLGGRLESRPYRIGLEVRCDVTDVLHRLRAGDVAGAVERYGGIPPYPETIAYVARVMALWHRLAAQ